MRWDQLQGRFLVYAGGGSKGSQASTTVNQLYSPEEAAQRALVMQEAGRIYGAAPALTPPAGPSADTLAAQQRMREFSTGAGQQMAEMAQGAMQYGLQGVLDPNDPRLQAYIASAQRPVTEAFTGPGGALSRIRGNFAGQDGRGSREQIATGIAERGYLNAMGDISSKIAYGAYGKGLDVFSRTLATAPSTYAMGLQPAFAQEAVGQQTEAYAEQQRQFEANAPWANLQNYANVVFGGSTPGTQTVSNIPGQGVTSTQRAGMTLAGGAAGAYYGAQAGSVGGPAGAAYGAGLGLLLSYL
jgi:hypothetical protein